MIEHFYQNIDGWFNFKSIYSYISKNMKDGDHYVEIGAWKGKSSVFMATEIFNSDKRVKFDVIDTWEGSLEHSDNEYVKNKTLYDTFMNNMKPVSGYFNPLRMKSIDASKLYEDNSLDFILIDASHEYEDVKSDILHWYPKLKSGGMIAGDDYHYNWPGVIKAVNEVLPYKIIVDTVCWVHEKK
jgi:hypothetical protein